MPKGVNVLRKLFKSTLNPSKQNNASSSGSTASLDPKSVAVKRLGFKSGDVEEKDFIAPEIDFDSITAAYDTDGYVRQGVDKYIDLLWKEGYDIYGKNQNAVEFIKTRIKYMAMATGTPFEQFLYDISEELIKYHNVIIAKSRMNNPAQVPQGMNLIGMGGQPPVAGYFVLNCSTFSARRDQFGTVKAWLQKSDDDSKEKRFKPEDIVHIYYRREKGDLWAKPFLLPVLDDVRALREAEENILRMMWRGVFPFHHVKVGSDEMPASDGDIEKVEDQTARMEREGGLVTSHTVDIKAVASDKIINAAPYLKYFEERVFTGIGIPGIMFGRGNTANRSTGDNMASEVADRVRAYQRVFEMFFNSNVVNELLLEGGFDPILNEDDVVTFQFKENDVDRQHKIQNQAVFLYEHHAITEDEMRDMIGKDTLDDGDGRAKMYLNIVQQQQATMKTSNSGDGNGGDGDESSNKAQPTNQHGKKATAKKQTNYKLSDMVSIFDEVRGDVLNSLEILDEKNSDDEFFSKAENIDEFLNHSESCLKSVYNSVSVILTNHGVRDEASFKRISNILNEIYAQIAKTMTVYNNMTEAEYVLNSMFDIYRDNILNEIDKHERRS